ncbi:nuA3 HAT complex component nto1 [Tulasnella sp. JGI-2019a]|nr:nuA3 HAT complex component nto1 [Tulasnella sp. JGI-2019a]
MAPVGSKDSAPLPVISYRKIENDDFEEVAGAIDAHARNFGFNNPNPKPFKMPDHYIRHIEPLETELAVQVEYDMDEQDQQWLDAMNQDRLKDRQPRASYEIFEVIMDRLEKEWFELMKLIPKPEMAVPIEDSTCSICDDGEAENSNAILFCDGCNLAVHQECYGVPYIPEGQWLCRKCTVSPENPVSCMLCPNEGGAFKQTTQGLWAHLLCAIWIPEVTVSNQFIMEPIESIENIPKNRWKLHCSLCKERRGACIQCDIKTCFAAFHVTCARKHKLLSTMKSFAGQEEPSLRAFCEKHVPQEMRDLREAEGSITGANTERSEEPQPESPTARLTTTTNAPAALPSLESPSQSKAARAYSQSFSARDGPPLIPNIIVQRILAYIAKTKVGKKADFVTAVARYWSLKRESRRGAPLLKRLYLEPWTASTMSKKQSDEEKARKLEQVVSLRRDLENVRNLTELTRKREKEKLRSAQTIQAFITNFLFPSKPIMLSVLNDIIALDRASHFTHPVLKSEAPDYYDIIKKPMTWTKIHKKLENVEYMTVQDFKDDLLLVISNSLLYNAPNTPPYRAAVKIKLAAEPILARLDPLIPKPPEEVPADEQLVKEESDISATSPVGLETEQPTEPNVDIISPLEPALAALRLLSSESAIADLLDFTLTPESDPLASVFSFELGIHKPRPREPTLAPMTSEPDVMIDSGANEVDDSASAQHNRERDQTTASVSASSPKAMSSSQHDSQGPEYAARRAEQLEARRKERMMWKAWETRNLLEDVNLAPGVRAKTRNARKAALAFEAEVISGTGGGSMEDGSRGGGGGRSSEAAEDGTQSMVPDVDETAVQDGQVPDAAAGTDDTHPRKVSSSRKSKSRSSKPRRQPKRASSPRAPITIDGIEQPGSPTSRGVIRDEGEPSSVNDVPMVDAEDTGSVQAGPPKPARNRANTLQSQRDLTDAEAVSEVGSAQAIKSRSHKKRKRTPEVDPVAVIGPILVKDVAPHDSFLLFNQGWVLPAGSRRRAKDDRPVAPLPKSRKGEKARATSRTVNISSAAPESPLPIQSPALKNKAEDRLVNTSSRHGKGEEKRQDKTQMINEGVNDNQEAQASSSKTPLSPRSDSSDLSDLTSLSESSEPQDVEATQPSPVLVRTDKPFHRPVKGPVNEADDDMIESDDENPSVPNISAMSPHPETKAPQGPVVPPSSVLKPAFIRPSTRPPPLDSEVQEAGTLVWAKIESYPWTPAVVFEDDDVDEIPPSVLRAKPKKESVHHLVRFYDDAEAHAWAWLPREKLHLLGEDKDLDQWILEKQHYKSARKKEVCRLGYLQALEEIETPEDLANELKARSGSPNANA